MMTRPTPRAPRTVASSAPANLTSRTADEAIPDRLVAALSDTLADAIQWLQRRPDVATTVRVQQAVFGATAGYAAWGRTTQRAPQTMLVRVKRVFEPHLHTLGSAVAADTLRALIVPAFLAGYYGPDGPARDPSLRGDARDVGPAAPLAMGRRP